MTGKKKMKSMHGYLVRAKKKSRTNTKSESTKVSILNMEELEIDMETEFPNILDNLAPTNESPDKLSELDTPNRSISDFEDILPLMPILPQNKDMDREKHSGNEETSFEIAPNQNFDCYNCDEKFSTILELKTHFLSKHKDKDNEEKTINREKTIENKPDEISDCDEKFTTILGLQTHVSSKHNEEDQEEIQNKEKSIKGDS